MSSPVRLFEQWKAEHCELDDYAMELASWIHQQSKQRNLQFREAVERLADLSARLASHFDREQEIGEKIVTAQRHLSPEAVSLEQHEEQEAESVGWMLPRKSVR